MRSDRKILNNSNIKNNYPDGPRAHRPMKMNSILIFNLYCEKNKKRALNQPMFKNQKAYEKHLNPVPVENRPMSEILKSQNSITLWTMIVSLKNQLKSKNPMTNDHHNQSLSLENRPMSKIPKNKMSLTLWTKIESLKNQLMSKNPKTNGDHRNPLSFENRLKSEILKTVLMIPVIVLLSILLFLKSGIFLRGLYRPVLIDMPKPYDPKPLYRLKNQSVGITAETNFALETVNLHNYRTNKCKPALIGSIGKTPETYFLQFNQQSDNE